MPAIISRERVNSNVVIVPLCRTIDCSVFIFTEGLDHDRTTRRSIAAVNPGLIEIKVHHLAVAAALAIVIINGNGFHQICLLGVILRDRVIKVMTGRFLADFINKISISGRILIIQRKNNFRFYASPVSLICISGQFPGVSLTGICFRDPVSFGIQNLFLSIRIHAVDRVFHRFRIRSSRPGLAQLKPDRASQRIRDRSDSGLRCSPGAISRSHLCNFVSIKLAAAVFNGKGIILIQGDISCSDISTFLYLIRHIGVEVAVTVGHRQILECSAGSQIIIIGKSGDALYQWIPIAVIDNLCLVSICRITSQSDMYGITCHLQGCTLGNPVFPYRDTGCVFNIFVENRSAVRAADRCFLAGCILIDCLIISVIRGRDGLLYDIVVLIALAVIGIQFVKAERICFSLCTVIRCRLNRDQFHVLGVGSGVAVQSQLCRRTKRREQIIPFLRCRKVRLLGNGAGDCCAVPCIRAVLMNAGHVCNLRRIANFLAIGSSFIVNRKGLEIVAVRAVHGIAIGRQTMNGYCIGAITVIGDNNICISDFCIRLTVIDIKKILNIFSSRSYPFCIIGILPLNCGLKCIFLRINKVLTIILLAVSSRYSLLINAIGNLLVRIGSICILYCQIFRKHRIVKRIDTFVAVCSESLCKSFWNLQCCIIGIIPCCAIICRVLERHQIRGIFMCSCICSIIEPGLCEGRLFVCGLFHPNEIVCGITAQLCFRNCANTGISVGARNRIRRKCGENIPVTGGTDLERSTLGNSNRMRFAIPPIGNLAARIRMPIVIRHRPVALVVQSITCTPCDDIVDRNIDFRNAQFQCSGIPISVRQRSCF